MTDVTKKLGRDSATGFTYSLQNRAPFRRLKANCFLLEFSAYSQSTNGSSWLKLWSGKSGQREVYSTVRRAPKSLLCGYSSRMSAPKLSSEPILSRRRPAVVEPPTHTHSRSKQIRSCRGKAFQSRERPRHLRYMVSILSRLLRFKLFDGILSVLMRYLTILRDPKCLNAWHISLLCVHNPEKC